MNIEQAIDILRTLINTTLMIVAPILGAAVVVGVMVSLFQSVTSIQEQTLTFVPKALAIVALLILLMPWMLRTLVEFAAGMIGKMPQMAQ